MHYQVTVIIPTHQRHHLLSRVVKYYKKLEAYIIIVDSSKKEWVADLPGNFKYLHYPLMSFGDKLNNAVDEVSTKYSLLCADDDFHAKNGIIQGIDFLEQNLDYVSVQGNIISFYKMNSKVIYRAGHNREGYKIEGSTPLDRIKSAFSGDYMHQIYSLHRTTNLAKCLEITKGLNAITPVEIATTLVSAVRGNHKILPIFWLARDNRLHSNYNIDISDEQDSSSREGPYFIVNDWESYLSSSEGLLFKQQFVDSIEVEKKQGSMLFELAFSSYIGRQKDKKKNYFNYFVMKFAKSIKQKIPSQLYKKISILYIFATYSKNRFSTRHLKGYPFSSKQAENDWKMITIALTKG